MQVIKAFISKQNLVLMDGIILKDSIEEAKKYVEEEYEICEEDPEYKFDFRLIDIKEHEEFVETCLKLEAIY